MTLKLAPLNETQRAAIRERLHRTGRAQVDGVLADRDALALNQAAAGAEYNIVTRRGSGHVDLPAAWLASLSPDQKTALGQAVQTSGPRRLPVSVRQPPDL